LPLALTNMIEQLKSLDWNIQMVSLLMLFNILFVIIFRFLIPCLLLERLSQRFHIFFEKRRIQKKKPCHQQKIHEIKYSLLSSISYAIILLMIETMLHFNIVHIYNQIKSSQEFIYTILSVPLALLIHDFYFFWVHKLLHTRLLYLKVHRIHHFSGNPSVWAMQSLHPLESLLQGLCVPFILWILPWHPIAFLVYLNLLTYFDVIAHSGFEFRSHRHIPKCISSLITSSYYHNFHHQNPSYHLGLLTRVWDKIFHTDHHSYDDLIKKF